MFASIQALLEILDRANTGPVCKAIDWDSKLIPSEAMRKLKEHGLLKTFNPENPINTDNGLANEFYKAGYELAIELGMYCPDTERIIKISEEELKESIKNSLSEIKLGEGLDEVIMKHRKPEDPFKPLWVSPLAELVTEEYYIMITQGIVQNREVDILQGCSLETIFGKPIKAGTPYETLAGFYNAKLTKEALWRAGRPGMPCEAVMVSPTVFGQLGGFGIPNGFDPKKDIALVLLPPELKTTYMAFHKIAHAINCGSKIYAGFESFVGGYAGPPEATAIVAIANMLLSPIIRKATYFGVAIQDIRCGGNSNREGVWTTSIIQQALSMNTNLLSNSVTTELAGPCTEMLLYECAVTAMNDSVSGVSVSRGPRTLTGRYANHITPLECKFGGEVVKACAGMKRSHANEIVKAIMPKYEEKLKNPPKGKPFQECYDIKALKPSKEWLEIYINVKKELIELGCPIPL
ncbi:MAG: monomethylamine:corrinoid methyltransferase [Candidatus Bathyarchaeia archaeon]